MDDANQRIQGMLGTATANPTGAATQSNPAIKNIATNGKFIIQNVSEITKSITKLASTWGA